MIGRGNAAGKDAARKFLCLTCKHSKSPCSAGSCRTPGAGRDPEHIVCQVRINSLGDALDYDFDPYTCKYYFPEFFRLY
ncbi:MAG: hypothetical protein ACTSU5_02660 [Promethearchaeota archaeon]